MAILVSGQTDRILPGLSYKDVACKFLTQISRVNHMGLMIYDVYLGLKRKIIIVISFELAFAYKKISAQGIIDDNFICNINTPRQ